MGLKSRHPVSRLVLELARVRALDPRYQVFGASEHRYELGAPLSAASLAAFEERERVRLPASYRAFLRHAGDGGAGPGYGLYSLAEARAGAGWIPGMRCLWRVPKRDDGFRRHLLLAHHGCGSFSFLTLSGVGRGRVWSGLDSPEHEADDFGAWYARWLDRAYDQSADRERRRLAAIAELEARLVKEGDDASVFADLARALDVPATEDRALRCWERAHALAPGSYSTARTLARTYGALGRHDDTIAVCRVSAPHMTEDRHRAELLHLSGLAFALTRRLDDATAALDQARALAPTLKMGQALAVVALHRGAPRQALEHLRSTATDAWVLHVRGLCHAALGDLGRAEAMFVDSIAARTPPAAVAAARDSLAALRTQRDRAER